tara:strand:- start:1471 stop:1617 length:147 start_codon:yes stop_codon:yes gene_type:complete
MGYSSLSVEELEKMNNGQIINRMFRLLNTYALNPKFEREMADLINRLQ